MTSKRTFTLVFVVSFLVACVSAGLLVYQESVYRHTGNWLDVVFIVAMVAAYYTAVRLWT